MTPNHEIQLLEVTKIFQTGLFRKKTAVEDLSLSIPSGQIIGLLGANGSGKSTTLKMILGFLQPTRGKILIGGRKAGTREARRLIGYLPENPRFQKFLTGKEILTYFGRLQGMTGKKLTQRMDALLELVGLSNAATERVGGYSKGMGQRLAVAQAILSSPPVLILDEPMSGLDPIGRREMRDLIRRIHQEMPQSTLFFSSHVLSDVEEVCSWVALLKRGRLEVFCPIADLIGQDCEQFSLTLRDLPSLTQQELLKKQTAIESPLGITLTLLGMEALMETIAQAQKAGGKIVGISTKRKGLEQALFSDSAKLSPSPSELGGAA